MLNHSGEFSQNRDDITANNRQTNNTQRPLPPITARGRRHRLLIKIDLPDLICVDLGGCSILHRVAPLSFLKTFELNLNTPLELASGKENLLSNNHHTQQTEKQQISIAERVFLAEGRRVLPYKTDVGPPVSG